MERDYMSVVCSSSASMPSNTSVTPNMRTSSGAAPPQTHQTGPLQSGAQLHHPISAVGCMASRILSRNANGTIAMTSQPANESELQLYRVLQRANLLSYYDTFICQGGDDVQQLCEAGEEEFLEIMALVGMASKPLHVRRLQKALQEWVTNPAMFQSPIVPTFPSAGGPPLPPPPSSHSVLNQLAVAMASRPSPLALSASQASPIAMRTSPSASMTATASATQGCNSTHSTPSPNSGKEQIISSSNIHSQNQMNQYMNQVSSGMICTEYSQPSSPITLTPVLVESQIQRLSEVAELLVKSLPPMDPKPQLGNNKKRISKELEYVMNMPEDDPRRMDEIRKYAAIYGRFDCKRKPEKPLTLHEVSVNEAAAQICRHIPALLSRRDELFPLARQVVRDSGYQYSKGHSRSQSCTKTYDDSDQSSCKRSRTESSPNHESKINFNDEDRKRKQERLESIVDQLKSLGNQHEDIKLQLQQANDLQNFQAVNQLQNELDLISTQQMQLINEQSEINKHLRRYEKMYLNRNFGRFEADKIDTDDTDSQFSLYSNESSPSVIADSQQNSPNQETSQNSSDGFSKLLPTKKTGNTVAANHITKQLVQETLMDEGLRVVKELANQIKEDGSGVDLRVFNKALDSPRTSSSSTCTVSSSSPALDIRCGYKPDTPRPRGRPPKFLDREYQHPIYHNQMMAQNHHNHIPHQMLTNFLSTQLQQNFTQSAILNSNGFGNCSVVNSIVDEEIREINDSTNGHFNPQTPQKSGILNSPTDLSKYNNNPTIINGSKDCNLSTSPNSLNALISLNGNGMNSESIKQETHSALELPTSLIKLT